MVAGVHYSVVGDAITGVNPNRAGRWGEPATAAQRTRIQGHLKKLGRYSGALDGIWGVGTIKGIQTELWKRGYYNGGIDAVVGFATSTSACSYASGYPNHLYPSQKDMKTMPAVWNQFENRIKSYL